MPALLRQTIKGFSFFVVAMALCLFGAAGTIHFWQGWLYLLVFGGCTAAITVYLLRYDQALLARRVNAGPGAEKERTQQVIQAVASLAFLGMLIIPGLDRRFGWSPVPSEITWIAAGIVTLSFFVIFLVFRANSFTSATVEVADGQRVIAGGPYAVVRHPMYAGAVLLFAATPPALGSWTGEVSSAVLLGVLVLRLLDEERYLRQHLAGYREYQQQVRHRLVPGVW